MNMKLLVLPCALLTLALGGSASAQSEVQIGPNGVKIKTPGSSVEVDGHGVRIKNGHQRVRVGNGVRVNTGVKMKTRATKAKPYICKGNQDRRLSDVNIDVKGTAIVAKGNCTLTIVNSSITAGKFGIKASGNATVNLVNTKVRGHKAGAHISGNATVTTKNNSKVRGKVITKGNGDFEQE